MDPGQDQVVSGKTNGIIFTTRKIAGSKQAGYFLYMSKREKTAYLDCNRKELEYILLDILQMRTNLNPEKANDVTSSLLNERKIAEVKPIEGFCLNQSLVIINNDAKGKEINNLIFLNPHNGKLEKIKISQKC